MIDTLLGFVVLALLTSWMLGATSIQSRLLATSASLNTREQLDYLRAAAVASNSPDACTDPESFLASIKAFRRVRPNSLGDLRSLLIDPQVMVREDSESRGDVVDWLKQIGHYPFTDQEGGLDANAIKGLLPSGNSAEPGNINLPAAVGEDWSITQPPARGENQPEPMNLWLCP